MIYKRIAEKKRNFNICISSRKLFDLNKKKKKKEIRIRKVYSSFRVDRKSRKEKEISKGFEIPSRKVIRNDGKIYEITRWSTIKNFKIEKIGFFSIENRTMVSIV